MNSNPNENGQSNVERSEVLSPNIEHLSVEEGNNVEAEALVNNVEAEASRAADAYNAKAAPVAPQLDRVQLIDNKPKLHAVQMNGVSMATEKKPEYSEKTEILEPINPDTVTNEQGDSSGPSKLSIIGLFFLFGGLFALVIFLPNISSYFSTMRYLKSQPKEEKILNGNLICTLDSNSQEMDYSYEFNFSFSDNKLSQLKSLTEIRGDVSLDESELDKLYAECQVLESVVENLDGVGVSCKLENGLMTKKQTFDFSTIVVDDAITAFIEAGGSYPFYRKGDNIDKIEKELISRVSGI